MLHQPTKESKKEESKEESKKEESKKERAKNLVVDDVAVINTQGASGSSRCWRCCEELCVRCGASAHHGSDCAVAHEASLGGVANSEGWVRCTKCRHLIHRVDGCDHMTCRCGAEFCFQCGAMPHCGTTCKKKSQQQASAGGSPPAAMAAAGGGFGAAAPGTKGRDAPEPAAGGGFGAAAFAGRYDREPPRAPQASWE